MAGLLDCRQKPRSAVLATSEDFCLHSRWLDRACRSTTLDWAFWSHAASVDKFIPDNKHGFVDGLDGCMLPGEHRASAVFLAAEFHSRRWNSLLQRDGHVPGWRMQKHRHRSSRSADHGDSASANRRPFPQEHTLLLRSRRPQIHWRGDPGNPPYPTGSTFEVRYCTLHPSFSTARSPFEFVGVICVGSFFAGSASFISSRSKRWNRADTTRS